MGESSAVHSVEVMVQPVSSAAAGLEGFGVN